MTSSCISKTSIWYTLWIILYLNLPQNWHYMRRENRVSRLDTFFKKVLVQSQVITPRQTRCQSILPSQFSTLYLLCVQSPPGSSLCTLIDEIHDYFSRSWLFTHSNLPFLTASPDIKMLRRGIKWHQWSQSFTRN